MKMTKEKGVLAQIHSKDGGGDSEGDEGKDVPHV
jgi:hypothetical protein